MLSSLLTTAYFTNTSICLRLTSNTTSLSFIKQQQTNNTLNTETFLGFSILNNSISTYTITMAKTQLLSFYCSQVFVSSVKFSSTFGFTLISSHHHHQQLNSVRLAWHPDCSIHLLIHWLTYYFQNWSHLNAPAIPFSKISLVVSLNWHLKEDRFFLQSKRAVLFSTIL